MPKLKKIKLELYNIFTTTTIANQYFNEFGGGFKTWPPYSIPDISEWIFQFNSLRKEVMLQCRVDLCGI